MKTRKQIEDKIARFKNQAIQFREMAGAHWRENREEKAMKCGAMADAMSEKFELLEWVLEND